MATSIDSSNSSSESDENSEKLDPRSPLFDARRALYAKNVKLPVPTARQFNNVAEFENYLQGKDSESLKKNKLLKEKHPGIIAERAAAQARENVRKAAILAKCEGPSERSQTQMRRTRATTVFTRIEAVVGPVSLLRRCMEEKLKVLVVIRAAVSVRSRCKGYVIAFDKHFNMALMDVDETYIRCKKKKEEKTTESGSSEQDTSKAGTGADSAQLDKPDTSSNQDKMVKSHASRTQLSDTKLTESVVRDKLSKIFHRNSPDRTGLSESYSEKCNISSPQSREPSKDARIKTELDKESENSDSKSSSSSTCNTRGKSSVKIEPTSDGANAQVGLPERTKTENVPLKDDSAFWELYKTWAEKRCLTSFEVLERHVNQLFIRGDNVVSVSIAQ